MNRENIIYGAGDFGKRLYNFFDGINVKIDYFCQTNMDEYEEKVCGIPVISIHDLDKINKDKNIFIAIKDAHVSASVKRELTTVVSDNDSIFQCGDFVRENLVLQNFEKTMSKDKRAKCNICGSEISGFLRGGESYDIFTQHHIIGGGIRENCICPRCGSYDRTRWCKDVIMNYTNMLNTSCRILHFAPEASLYEIIKENELADYYCGDIERKIVNNTIDVTDMEQFNDSTFDYIIVNHVLEHVMDYKKALLELKRVLKQNGSIIMSFPICTDMPTIECTEEMTEKDRIINFGQKDHVRLFGNDFKKLIESQGLKVTIATPNKEYDSEQIQYYGFIQDDVILVCKK